MPQHNTEKQQNPMTKTVLTFLACLLVAFALWMYVVMAVGPEYKDTFRDIPVTYVGLSDLENNGFMLISEGTPKVTLELSGNRSDLNKLTSSNITVTVDLSKIEMAGSHSMNYKVEYPVNVSKESITVENGTPGGIVVEVVRSDYKDIPIYIETVGEMPEDYIQEKAVLEMDTLRIYGPEDVVARIHAAWIQIEVNEQTKADIVGEFTYTLCNREQEPVDSKHITVTTENAESIFVTVPIKRIKEIPLVINVIAGGGATEQTSSIVLDPRSIWISGSEEALANLEMLELGTIDLSTVLQDTVLTFPITLPEDADITNETGITEVSVTVSFPNLVTKTFQVTQIKTGNVPEGMTATVSKKVIEVQIRGERSVIENLTAQDITVIVDCEAAKQGNQRLEASVLIGGNTGAGAVGVYEILVNVEPAEG